MTIGVMAWVTPVVNETTNKVYACLPTSNQVLEVRCPSHATSYVTTAAGPFALTVNPITDRIYALCPGANEVDEINGATHAVTIHATGNNPSGVAVNTTTGKVFAPNYNDGTVTVF